MDLRYELDEDGRPYLPIINGDLQLTRSRAEAVKQRLEIRLGMQLGEWALDQSLGLPWREQILVRNPDLGAIRAFLLSAILEDEEIDEVTELSIERDRERRCLSISFRATLDAPEDGLQNAEEDQLIGEASIYPDGTLALLMMIEPVGGY